MHYCTCELPDCIGQGKEWTSLGEEIPARCRWCKRRTWNGRDKRQDRKGKKIIYVDPETVSREFDFSEPEQRPNGKAAKIAVPASKPNGAAAGARPKKKLGKIVLQLPKPAKRRPLDAD